MICSKVGGYPVTGSFSRTAINAESGARSPLSTAVAAAAVVVVLLLFTSFLESLPKAAVSAIVLSCIVRLIDIREFWRLVEEWKRENNPDIFVFCTVVLASLLKGVENGLLMGVIVHFLIKKFYRRALLRQSNHV